MATSGGLITLRPREFFLYGELAHEMIHITLGISAYIANFGFFSWWSEGYTAGDSMYVANNIVEIFMNLHSMHESRAYLREHEGQLLPYQIGNTKHEFRLNLCYLLGAICFAVGALLFEIPVYEACQDAIPCLAGGTWMFTFGSLFFVVASFANTMGVAVVGTIEMQDYETRLAVLALGFNTAGSAFYLAGSPFYFPQVDGSGQTWGSGDVGTLLYVLGGTCFMCAKVMRLMLTIKKHDDEVGERNRICPKKEGRVHHHDRINKRRSMAYESTALESNEKGGVVKGPLGHTISTDAYLTRASALN